MTRMQKPKNMATKIPQALEELIVEVSLQHPDFGARRLARLLKEEEIVLSVSAVYNILKRNGLNTRAKRLAILEKQNAPLSLPPRDSDLPPPAEEMHQTVKKAANIAASSRISSGSERHRRSAGRSPWLLTLFNFVLLALLIFLGVYTLQKASSVSLAPVAEAAIETAPKVTAMKFKSTSRPLSSYRIIWQRDLFKTAGNKQPETEKEISPDELALAAKDLGLKLMGTVVADDPAMSRAVIDNHSIRKQEIYREGDRAGEVLIKKILRNKVVITTKKGNELLTVNFEETSRQRAAAGPSSPSRISRNQSPRAKTRTIQLERKEVEASFSDLDQLLQEVNISPFKQGGQSAGFKITNITPGSILAKMGLRNDHVITGVDDEIITGPDQAAEFFQRLKEGGDITIQTRKSRGVRRRSRSIRLKIE